MGMRQSFDFRYLLIEKTGTSPNLGVVPVFCYVMHHHYNPLLFKTDSSLHPLCQRILYNNHYNPFQIPSSQQYNTLHYHLLILSIQGFSHALGYVITIIVSG